jgi:hypothetical protein
LVALAISIHIGLARDDVILFRKQPSEDYQHEHLQKGQAGKCPSDPFIFQCPCEQDSLASKVTHYGSSLIITKAAMVEDWIREAQSKINLEYFSITLVNATKKQSSSTQAEERLGYEFLDSKGILPVIMTTDEFATKKIAKFYILLCTIDSVTKNVFQFIENNNPNQKRENKVKAFNNYLEAQHRLNQEAANSPTTRLNLSKTMQNQQFDNWDEAKFYFGAVRFNRIIVDEAHFQGSPTHSAVLYIFDKLANSSRTLKLHSQTPPISHLWLLTGTPFTRDGIWNMRGWLKCIDKLSYITHLPDHPLHNTLNWAKIEELANRTRKAMTGGKMAELDSIIGPMNSTIANLLLLRRDSNTIWFDNKDIGSHLVKHKPIDVQRPLDIGTQYEHYFRSQSLAETLKLSEKSKKEYQEWLNRGKQSGSKEPDSLPRGVLENIRRGMVGSIFPTLLRLQIEDKKAKWSLTEESINIVKKMSDEERKKFLKNLFDESPKLQQFRKDFQELRAKSPSQKLKAIILTSSPLTSYLIAEVRNNPMIPLA